MKKHKPYGPYEKFIKRPLDVICSLLALIVFCWLYAIVAILVRVKLGSPVLFKQDRPGKDEKIFKLCTHLGVPCIAAMGRKGGSSIAAAVCNALIYTAADLLDPAARGWN